MGAYIRSAKNSAWYNEADESEHYMCIIQTTREIAGSFDSPPEDEEGPMEIMVDDVLVEYDDLSKEAREAADKLLASDGWMPA